MADFETRLTMRAVLALGLPGMALGLGRTRRWRRALRDRAGSETGRGNLLTAGLLVAIYLAAFWPFTLPQWFFNTTKEVE